MNEINHCTPSTCSKTLRSVASFAKIYVLKCQTERCHSGTIIKWQKDEKLNWLLHLECTNCNDEWAVCSTCINFHVGFKSKRQISMHKYTYHKTTNGIIPKSNPKRKHIKDKIAEYILNRQKKKTSLDDVNDVNYNDQNDNDDNIVNNNKNDCNILNNITDDNNHGEFDNETEHEGKIIICSITSIFIILIINLIQNHFVHNDVHFGYVTKLTGFGYIFGYIYYYLI
jgi:hypothetical protein